MSARAATIGIGYHLWLRSRWAVLATLGGIATLAVLMHLLSSHGTAHLVALFFGLAPIGIAAAFLVGVVTYSGDMSTPESGFPRHMMVLPLSSAALTLTPMVYGIACLGALWVMIARLVLVPAGWDVPIVRPVAAIAAVLTWLQATSWMPFWLPFARVAACIASLFAIVAFALAAHFLRIGEPTLIAGLLVAMVLAVPAAVAGVARARRGDGTVAPWVGHRTRAATDAPRRRPFTSAERAQIWLELRRNCTILAVFVLSMGMLVLLPALFSGRSPSPLYVVGIMVPPHILFMTVFLGSPVFLAGAMAANLAKPDAWSKSLTIPSFLAARPMGDTTPIAAKLKATALSVAIIWAILLAVLAIDCLLPHSYSQTESMAHLLLRHATPHRVALAAAVLGALVLTTWLNVIKGFVFSLYGRAWLVNTTGFGLLSVYMGLGGLGYWAWLHPGSRTAVLYGARLALWILLAAKIVTAALVVRASRQHRIATDARLVAWTAAWLLVAVLIFSMACWLFPAARNSVPLLAAGVALSVPYNRLVAMPLAWHLNRHR